MADKNCIKKPTPTSLFCELARLKSQQIYLEKTQNSLKLHLLDVDTTEKSFFAEIEKLQLEIGEKFDVAHNEAKYETKVLFDEINNFEANMLTEESLKNYNVITYREKVVELDNDITNICKAGKMKLEILRANYKEMETSLPSAITLLRDVPKYHVTKQVSKLLQNVGTKIPDDNFKEVKIFDNFLLNYGGNTGNWNEEEHLIYLKNKCKYKSNLERIISCIQAILPNLSDCEIKKHDLWFNEFTILKQNKKIAIENWRKSKSI